MAGQAKRVNVNKNINYKPLYVADSSGVMILMLPI